MMFVGTASVLYSSFWGRFVTYAVAAVNDGHMGLDVSYGNILPSMRKIQYRKNIATQSKSIS